MLQCVGEALDRQGAKRGHKPDDEIIGGRNFFVSIKILGKVPAVTAQENQFRRALNPNLLAGVQAELKKWDHQKN